MKVESMGSGEGLGRAKGFALRNGPYVRIRADNGAWRDAYQHLAPFDSMMTHCSDPREALELLLLRERMRDWRFFDPFSAHPDAPSPRPPAGPPTPTPARDGTVFGAPPPTTPPTRTRPRPGC